MNLRLIARKNGWQRRLKKAIYVTLISVLVAIPAFSADSDADANISLMKKVLVSATRTKTELEEVTRSVAVLEKEEIETLQPKSVAEVLRFEPNVTVVGGPRSGLQSVNIRGLEGNKVLQTIDGVRQEFNSGHRPAYFLDPELLQKVEVVKGPLSSLWGSGAIGGVVAQSTINANDILTPNETLGGFVKSGFNNNNDQSTTSAALAGRVDSIDWLLSGYYRDSNDLEMGNGDPLENSANRDHGLLAKASWQFTDDQSLGFSYRMADAAGNVPSNGAASLSNSNVLINRDQNTSALALDYQLDSDSPWLGASAKLYWNNVDIDEYRVSDGRADSTELDVYGVQFSNQSLLGKATLLYGLDGYREEFDASRNGANRPIPPEAQTDVWGVFMQTNIPIAQRWAVELGARYDDFSSTSDNLGVDNSDSEMSPFAAVIWQAADWLEFTLRHDQAFRAPGSEELYTTGTHFCIGPPFGCNTFVSNPDLKPEDAANTELLAKMRFAGLFADDQLHINLSVFQNKVDDFIEQIVIGPSFEPFPNAGTSTWRNVDKAELEGFEVSANYQLRKLDVKLAYGHVRGEDDATGRDLSNIPADTVTADLSYGFLNDQLTAGVRVIDAATQSRTPDDRRFQGYTIGDLYATWQPTSLDNIKIALTINNVTDRHYQRAFEELPEAGREVIASARFDF